MFQAGMVSNVAFGSPVMTMLWCCRSGAWHPVTKPACSASINSCKGSASAASVAFTIFMKLLSIRTKAAARRPTNSHPWSMRRHPGCQTHSSHNHAGVGTASNPGGLTVPNAAPCGGDALDGFLQFRGGSRPRQAHERIQPPAGREHGPRGDDDMALRHGGSQGCRAPAGKLAP